MDYGFPLCALGVFEEQSPVSCRRRGLLGERRRPQGGCPARVRLEHERQLPLPAPLSGKPKEHGEELQGPGDQVRPAVLNMAKFRLLHMAFAIEKKNPILFMY